MSKNAIVTIVVLIVVVILGWFLFSGKQAVAPVDTNQDTTVVLVATSTDATALSTTKTVTVTYTSNGFSPSLATINAGDTVIFKNEGTSDFWPASAAHPTHTVYPGSGIDKCGTSAQASIFDACQNYAPGTSWSFVFTNKGSWAYHNHLNPRQFGKIVVE